MKIGSSRPALYSSYPSVLSLFLYMSIRKGVHLTRHVLIMWPFVRPCFIFHFVARQTSAEQKKLFLPPPVSLMEINVTLTGGAWASGNAAASSCKHVDTRVIRRALALHKINVTLHVLVKATQSDAFWRQILNPESVLECPLPLPSPSVLSLKVVQSKCTSERCKTRLNRPPEFHGGKILENFLEEAQC